MMSAVTPKEHPLSSHMSRLAVFPSFFPSDESESRSTSRAFLDSCVPNRVQNVILLSKTKGKTVKKNKDVEYKLKLLPMLCKKIGILFFVFFVFLLFKSQYLYSILGTLLFTFDLILSAFVEIYSFRDLFCSD